MLLKASFRGLHSFPLSVPRDDLIMAPAEIESFGHVNVYVFRPILLAEFSVVDCIILLLITSVNHAKSLNVVHLVVIVLIS